MPSANPTQIAFVLNNVADYQTLAAGIPEGTPVYVLDANGNALEEMARILGSYSHLDAIHLLSHGNTGSLDLGEVTLTTDNLAQYSNLLAQIGAALTEEGDLLVYGCNVAEGAQGSAFVEQLAQYTGADVAASDDRTGNSVLGGDWVLEDQVGTLSTSVLQLDHYNSVLSPLNSPVIDLNGAAAGTGNTVTLADAANGALLLCADTCEARHPRRCGQWFKYHRPNQ